MRPCRVSVLHYMFFSGKYTEHIAHISGETAERSVSGIIALRIKMRRAVFIGIAHGKGVRDKIIDAAHQHVVGDPFHRAHRFSPAVGTEYLAQRPALHARIDVRGR